MLRVSVCGIEIFSLFTHGYFSAEVFGDVLEGVKLRTLVF